MNRLIYIIIIFILNGCSSAIPFKIPDHEKPEPFKFSNSIIRNHEIHDFITVDDDLDKIPDNIKIEIILTEPVSLNSLFQILILQGVSCVGDYNSEKLISIPAFTGSLKLFLKTIQLSHGFFFKYNNNILTIREASSVYVKVFMPNIEDKIISLIQSFGVQNVFYDKLSSRVVFQSDFYLYQKIQEYFYNNPYLTLVVFDVMVLENEETKHSKSGFDFSSLSIILNDLTQNSGSILGSSSGFVVNLTKVIGGKSLSIGSVYNNLLQYENFSILQAARISTLSGYECNLKVSEKIPYVEKINISSLNETTNVVQGFEFNHVDSGINLTLNPVVTDNLVSILFKVKIDSLIKFLEVGSELQKVQQPVISTRSLENQIVLKAGETHLIGGLRYSKGSKTKKSLIFLKNGLKGNDARTFSISILLRSEIIRYVFRR